MCGACNRAATQMNGPVPAPTTCVIGCARGANAWTDGTQIMSLCRSPLMLWHQVGWQGRAFAIRRRFAIRASGVEAATDLGVAPTEGGHLPVWGISFQTLGHHSGQVSGSTVCLCTLLLTSADTARLVGIAKRIRSADALRNVRFCPVRFRWSHRACHQRCRYCSTSVRCSLKSAASPRQTISPLSMTK